MFPDVPRGAVLPPSQIVFFYGFPLAFVANDAVLLLLLCCYGDLQRTDNIGLVFVLDFLGVQN